MAGRSPPDALFAALDEIRFGADNILNLRDGLPTAEDASRRAESWLRERQVRGASEVLVVTGRGKGSTDGVPAVRMAVERLLFSLRRRGVIDGHGEHNPGAFVVKVAPIRALVDAAPRRREPRVRRELAPIPGLGDETVALLRNLSEASLSALGVVPDDSNIPDEMQRHLKAIVPGLRGGDDMERQLQSALRTAVAEYD